MTTAHKMQAHVDLDDMRESLVVKRANNVLKIEHQNYIYVYCQTYIAYCAIFCKFSFYIILPPEHSHVFS